MPRFHRPALETAPPHTTRAIQLVRLNGLLRRILPSNGFYGRKFAGLQLPINWRDFSMLPLTTRDELIADQAASPPFGTNVTWPSEHYAWCHSVGVTGRMLTVPETSESLSWWAECGQYVFAAAGVTPVDRVFIAVPSQPFVALWMTARRVGATTIRGDNVSPVDQLDLMMSSAASVLVCTTGHAFRLLAVARAREVTRTAIRIMVHPAERGASAADIRDRLQQGWSARCYDQPGTTETGPYAYSCELQHGVHVNEHEFIAEVLRPGSMEPVNHGDVGELVLTNLGRDGWPLVRYRTGELIRFAGHNCRCGRRWRFLPGGVLGTLTTSALDVGAIARPVDTVQQPMAEQRDPRAAGAQRPQQFVI